MSISIACAMIGLCLPKCALLVLGMNSMSNMQDIEFGNHDSQWVSDTIIDDVRFIS